MKYRAIREGAWKGIFYATVECSNCGQLLRDTQRKHAPVYCPHCAHKLRPLPIRISSDRIVGALNAFISYKPADRPLTQEQIDLKNSPLGITLGL